MRLLQRTRCGRYCRRLNGLGQGAENDRLTAGVFQRPHLLPGGNVAGVFGVSAAELRDALAADAEVTLDGTIHSHRVLEEIEARIARDCGLSTILITHWQRFEEPPATLPLERAA